MIRYDHGSGAITRTGSGGKRWERDVELGYTVQSGPLAWFNVCLNRANNRHSFNGDLDQMWLVMSCSLSQ